jgi:cobaltochelatase CobN
VGREGARVYGPAPGSFGLGMGADLGDYSDEGPAEGGRGLACRLRMGLRRRKRRAGRAGPPRPRRGGGGLRPPSGPARDRHPAAEDYATHEAGFAAAQKVAGGHAALYHLDNTDPARPRARALPEEVARVVLARAANPGWIAGMRRHGFRGAAEIATTLENMAAFAHLAGAVSPHLFDLFWEATLGDAEVTDFLGTANPEALAAMRARFAELHAAGLWRSRRNSILAEVEARA